MTGQFRTLAMSFFYASLNFSPEDFCGISDKNEVFWLAGGADTITVGMQVQFSLYSLTQA